MRLIIGAFVLIVFLASYALLNPSETKFMEDKNEGVYETAFSKVEEKAAVTSKEKTEELIKSNLSLEKFIKIDLSEQKLQLWQDDKMIEEYSVSTGKPGMKTPTGEFQVLGKEENHWSVKYSLYMPYSLRFHSDYFIHELPYWPGGYREGEEHLGAPVSHGCVRLGIGPAKIVYNWAHVGTKVVVID